MTNASKAYDSFESAGIYGINYNKPSEKYKCPKCEHTRKKNTADKPLSVSVEKGVWLCHNCEWTGVLKNHNYIPTVERIYSKPKEFTSRVSKYWIDWFSARGIQEHVINYFELGEFEYQDKKWIKFPYKRDKELVNAKSRSELKEFALTRNAELIFFNLDAIKDKKECVITEGEIDCMSLYQSNVFNAVSVPNGASKGNKKLEYLDNCADYFTEMEKVVLFTDNDEPGIALKEELARRIGRDKCFVVKYPENCKDANEVLQMHGSEYLNNLVKMSEPYPVEDVSKPSDYLDKILYYHKNGFPEGDKLGYSNFDKLLSFRPGELTIITGIPNSGKALCVNTLIPTPNGFSTMGELKVGDVVFDENGKQCNVIAATEIMYDRPCYKMTFNNGIEVICDENHNWLTRNDRERRSVGNAKKRFPDGVNLKKRGTDQSHKKSYPSVKTTKLISETLKVENGKRYNHFVKNADALITDHVDLPIPPYTLGAWLGDGTSANGNITFNDPEIFDYIKEDGFDYSAHNIKYHYTIRGLVSHLRENDLLKNKHIPKIYLRASKEQRLSLLHGLMDTDGHMGKDGRCEFCSVRKDLAEGVYELVASLGGIVRIFESRAKLYGKDCGPKYRVFFTPNGFNAFRLKRKLSGQKDRTLLRGSRVDGKHIISCDKIESVPVRCIQVDSMSSLFLCTKAMIPTHNSALLDQILIRLSSRHGWRHAVLSREQWPHDIHVTKLTQIFSGRGLRENNMTENIIRQSNAFLNEHFFLFGITELTVTGILEKAKRLVLKYGVKSLVIDPWNTLTHEKEGSDSETDYINEVLKQFVNFKDMYSVHVFLVAHPKKMMTEGTAENKKFATPTLYDISGSSHFFNMTDNGLTVYRNIGTKDPSKAPIGDIVTAHVQKVRNFFIGSQGSQNFEFNYLSGSYSEEFTDFECELDYWLYKTRQTSVQPTPIINIDKEVPTLTDMTKLSGIKTSFDDYTAPTETIFKFAENGELKPNTDIETPF